MNPLFRLPIKVLARGKLSVFVFHKVPVAADPLMPLDMDLAAFEYLLDSLVGAFNTISLADAVLGLRTGRLPPNAACITFDDGYASWVGGVVPALEKRNMHATFFITTGQFEGRPLWHERIAHAVRNTKLTNLDIGHPACSPMMLSSSADRSAAVLQLERFLKYFTLPARNELLCKLETTAGVNTEGVTRMSLADLRAIASKGFGIGAHTANHPILVYCDAASAMHEIAEVREVLRGYTGADVSMFAYPNGRPFADFSIDHVNLVKRAGYSSAVTTQRGVGGIGTSVYQIPRFTPWGIRPLSIAFQLAKNLLTPPDYLVE